MARNVPAGAAVAILAIIGAVTVSLISALLSFTTRKYETAPNPDAAIHLMTAEHAWLEWRFLGRYSLMNAVTIGA
jgi:quinol-cytochrome oxidoreductase complex cytochrome b subunit